MEKIIVSACLAGINCRYDGKSNLNLKIIKLINQGIAIPVYPEQLGGLPTPRIASEIKGDEVINKLGENVTEQFKKGAEETLNIAKTFNCKKAILVQKSPSCGCGLIYDGNFSGKLIQGDGITTRLLKQNNIKVITEKDLE